VNRVELAGTVTRTWVADSGKVAEVSLKTHGEYPCTARATGFDSQVAAIRNLAKGDDVAITGRLRNKKIEAKDGQPERWEVQVVADVVTTAAQPAPQPDDDQIPF